MSTIEQWEAFYENFCRTRYPWLPKGSFGPTTRAGWFYFNGFTPDGLAIFLLDLNYPLQEQVMWHEAGHAAHSYSAKVRDAAEGRGTAGDDICREIQAILAPGQKDWAYPDGRDRLAYEYVAEAWRKANTGDTGPGGYPNPPGQISPYPVDALLTYFRTMHEPRVSAPSVTFRYCFDSTNAKDIPPGAEIVAGYVDGLYKWTDEDWSLFPNSVKVRIAVFPTTNDGHVLDVEPGDATPDQAPAWVEMRRGEGVDPTVYTSTSWWPLVRKAFQDAKVKEPHYWIAKWDNDPTPIEGAVAKQYADPTFTHKHYDLSVVPGTWPGVEDMDRATFDKWFAENYVKYEVAKTFDEMKVVDANLSTELLKTNQRIDKLHEV